jgi:hypothetical protein
MNEAALATRTVWAVWGATLALTLGCSGSSPDSASSGPHGSGAHDGRRGLR